jgi:hypothetical protein
MTYRSNLMILLALCWTANSSSAAADPQHVSSQNVRPTRDPNQRICEDITQVGSRLATKRICATRAEWDDRRKQDREALDLARNRGAIPCMPINTRNPSQKSC